MEGSGAEGVRVREGGGGGREGKRGGVGAMEEKKVPVPQSKFASIQQKRSAKSGAHPSAPPRACNAVGNATNELAKERAQDTDSTRDHRLRHACAAEWNMAGGASRALAAAKLSLVTAPPKESLVGSCPP